VTGEVAFIAPPGAQVKDICGYLESAPRMLDISTVVKHYLEKNPDLSEPSVNELSAECVNAVERLRKASPETLEQYIGREIFSVVIASYDAHSKDSLVLNFVVRIDSATRQIEAARFTRIVISPESRRGVWSYGETDYLNKYVFGGVGREYLTKETMDFILIDKPVSDATLNQAVAVATNIIDATSRMTQIIPSPSGIGGPVDVILLGKKRRPIEIQWKASQRLEQPEEGTGAGLRVNLCESSLSVLAGTDAAYLFHARRQLLFAAFLRGVVVAAALSLPHATLRARRVAACLLISAPCLLHAGAGPR
jgi:hypothetical protein